MDNLSLEQKHEQFEEFFMIKHAIEMNIKVLATPVLLPSVENIQDHMPYAYQIASEISAIDVKALRPLRSMGEHAAELAEFLNHQSRKIDLMMSLILQQQSEDQETYHSFKFGGGGIVVNAANQWPAGCAMELRLFLREEAAAIFCYAEVIACKQQDEQYHTSLIFTRIREEDQDLLVRASLHLQAANLRKRHKQT